ncbi:uncharacterized protein LOC127283139 isoform X2 [Leptopilina boulardi]|nr:uncharacterized protein LOC127283139 isoform X2 [Leptopilina boulardi]
MMGSFPECDVKLCDFEISRVVLEGTEVREILGTPDYVAPEILHYEPITLAADMWSLGVTTYVLLTGFSPFGGETDQETFQNISLGEVDFPEELFEDVSAQAKDFVAKLLVLDPSARMTSKQCLRHEWLRGAPTQASPHLRRYLSKSREVLLERVVSRENLRRAALLSQASSNANLTESEQTTQGLNCTLSQSEMCLSYTRTGSRGSLPGSEEYMMSPADSQTSLNSSQTSLAMSQSCLLNKEQTQGLLTQAQSKSQANLNLGATRGLLSRMRSLNQIQSQACLLLNGNKSAGSKEILSPLFGRSREKLYGLKSLSKSQGVLDIYRSLECLRQRKKNQRAQTEDMLPIFKQLSVEIAASNASLVTSCDADNNNRSHLTTKISNKPPSPGVKRSESKIPCSIKAESGEHFRNDESDKIGKKHVEEMQDPVGKSELKLQDVLKSSTSGSEENLDSLQSIESDTLTEDSDETAPDRSLLSVKPCHRQHSDISNHSNNSANSDDKDEHSESENEEPKYTVAQLVSAFNKHQEVASKTSLEAIMTEKRVNEVTFPTGPKALRLFIPDINITERSIVRRKTSYKPRKNWEELRKRSEKNEGILKDFDNDSGNEDDDDDIDANETHQCEIEQNKITDQVTMDQTKINNTKTDETKINQTKFKTYNQSWPFESNKIKITSDDSNFLEEPEVRNTLDTRIDEKYKQCVDGVKATKFEKTDKFGKTEKSEKMEKLKNEKSEKTEKEKINRLEKGQKTCSKSPLYQKERIANYIYPEIQATSHTRKDDDHRIFSKSSSKFTDSSVNLKDILQKIDNFQTTPKENLENLRKRTTIAKIILNDNLPVDNNDTNNNNGTNPSSGNRLKHDHHEENSTKLDVPPSFVRSSSLSSEGSCPTPSSVQSLDIGMSWEDVHHANTRGSSTSLEKDEGKNSKRTIPTLWSTDLQKSDVPPRSTIEMRSRSSANLEDRKIWGKVCTGSYTRAMEKFNGKGADTNRKSGLLLNTTSQQLEKTRRKSTPVMPQFVDS